MIAFKKVGKVSSCAEEIYRKIVAQARTPVFYADLGVPDTVDGRFELITLHAFLVLRRLKPGTGRQCHIGQALFDVMFEDMDLSLREMGAGDIGVGKRIKAMVQAFYGRIASYEAGLESVEGELEEALWRNLYGTSEPSAPLVSELDSYMRRQEAHLASIDIQDVKSGAFDFDTPV